MHNGVWCSDHNVVKQTFLNLYKEEFATFKPTIPLEANSRFTRLDETENNELEREATKLEIKEVVWSYGSDKALGPDGYTFRFIKSF